MRRQCNSDCRLINIIVHSTHYFFSDWPKAFSEFSKSARGTFSSCRLYNNQVKDTQGHGYSCHVYDRGAWFLSVIMSSSLALCCLPSVKKQKHYFQVCFDDRARHRKSSWRQGLTNTKRSTKVAKELFADYVKEKKLREPEEMKWLAQTLKTFYVEAGKKGFVQCIIKQFLDSVFVISRIIKVSVRVISLSPTSTLIILDITKISSNNCLKKADIDSKFERFEVLSLTCDSFTWWLIYTLFSWIGD